jgi:putative ABC transport system permease protein
LDIARAFKIGSRSATASRERMVLRKVLIVAEMALAILLVLGAGLVIKSFRQLMNVDPGFRTENMLTARLSLPSRDYPGDRAVAFFTRLTEELKGLPGVENVAVVSRPPLYMDRSSAGRFHIEGRADTSPTESGFSASHVMVGRGSFETLQIPLVSGRLLDETDRPGAPLAVVIDEDMARTYWPGEDPIGARIRFARTDGPWHTVVGIVGNARFDGLNKKHPTFYYDQVQTAAWADFFTRTESVVVHTSVDPTSLAGPLRETVRRLDPNLPIVRLQTMEELVTKSLARPRFIMMLLGVFAGIALSLGAIGVYGVMSHGVAQRTNEIGIRIAMGAESAEVSGMVLRQGMGLALLGVLLGLVASLGAARSLAGFLFNVSTTDPGTYTAVAIVMVAVALLASYLPARRASKVDPIDALRYE